MVLMLGNNEIGDLTSLASFTYLGVWLPSISTATQRVWRTSRRCTAYCVRDGSKNWRSGFLSPSRPRPRVGRRAPAWAALHPLPARGRIGVSIDIVNARKQSL